MELSQNDIRNIKSVINDMEIEGHYLTWEQAEASYRKMLASEKERDKKARIETPGLFQKRNVPENVLLIRERHLAAKAKLAEKSSVDALAIPDQQAAHPLGFVS